MEIIDLEKLFDAKLETVNKSLEAILSQTIKTNGRVNKLEAWMNKVIGALLITEVILLPVAFMVIQKYV